MRAPLLRDSPVRAPTRPTAHYGGMRMPRAETANRQAPHSCVWGYKATWDAQGGTCGGHPAPTDGRFRPARLYLHRGPGHQGGCRGSADRAALSIEGQRRARAAVAAPRFDSAPAPAWSTGQRGVSLGGEAGLQATAGTSHRMRTAGKLRSGVGACFTNACDSQCRLKQADSRDASSAASSSCSFLHTVPWIFMSGFHAPHVHTVSRG